MLHTTHLSQYFKYEDADDMYTHQAGAMLSYSMLDSILQSRNHRFNLNANYVVLLMSVVSDPLQPWYGYLGH